MPSLKKTTVQKRFLVARRVYYEAVVAIAVEQSAVGIMVNNHASPRAPPSGSGGYRQ